MPQSLVKNYIHICVQYQHAHHQKKAFQDEHRAFLKSIMWSMTNVMSGIEGIFLAPLQGF